MLDKLLDISVLVALALACIFVARFLKSRKTEILFAISAAVQWAEKEVKGSKMGEAKKREVIFKLQQEGIKVTAWVGKAIDAAVAYLNKTGGWLKDTACAEVTDAATGAVSSIRGADGHD